MGYIYLLNTNTLTKKNKYKQKYLGNVTIVHVTMFQL